MTGNIVAIAALIVTAIIVLHPRLRGQEAWRATITPLASIIGSGFLVSLPLLARDVGVYAIAAIGFLIMLAYFLGGALRFNIKHGEPLFDGDGHVWVTRFDIASRIGLALAYLVSVTYYLSLLAAFSLKAFGLGGEELIARCITTALLALLGGWGFLHGLRGLEAIEEYAVGLKLAVIAAALAALAWLNIDLFAKNEWRILAPAPPLDFHHLRMVLGLLIVVQGFETSRFLKGAYPPQLRIDSMRWAQLISAVVYLAFFLLALPILHTAPHNADVAGVTDMVAPAASFLPLILIAGAVFAQLSAAVADAIGGAGLIHETSGARIARKWCYPAIAAAGCAIVWSFDVFRVIQLASSVFAIFYAMQAIGAIFVARRTEKIRHRAARMAGFGLLALIALGAAFLGIPAEAAG
ncbi:MAG: hypothetical protein KF779_07245 [Hyphomonadaceae bacterium]|nr:hypothetical protein [Hyphomonadaceae bacterium]MCA8886342.1 hypothetical protein [Hyphomonadaceae bacterium]